MPPGFGVLDTCLVSVPIFLTLLGLIRGAPVELASCLGCAAGAATAWIVSAMPFVEALGQPASPLLALLGGVVVWRLARGLSNRLGLDTRWIDLGRLFDSAVGGVMGGLRGVAFVSAACLAYAVIFVPLGLANPMRTVAYPVFLAVGSQVTSAVIASAGPSAGPADTAPAAQSFATVPLPFTAPQIGPQPQPVVAMAALPPPPLPTSNGAALASLMHVIAPSAAAAPTQPMPAYHPDIPVRGVPVALMETHHNILHPFGTAPRRRAHR